MKIVLPSLELQIEFSVALAEIRNVFLKEALRQTLKSIDISKLDKELSQYVPAHAMSLMASHGLRAEWIFPTPFLFLANPRLLGYYRLLFGFSQKIFYTAATGASPFKGMEERGTISKAVEAKIPELCEALILCGEALLNGIGPSRLSNDLLDDLTLLTVGPQLRGGANVKRGAKGIVQVFDAIHRIVEASVRDMDDSRMAIRNAAGRLVYIEFAPDPDIIIREEIAPNSFSEKIAIEVKAGEDFSNIHNRIGEAEKSHQKAKARGYVECWTVVNVDRIDMSMAKAESPSTNRFFRLSAILSNAGPEFEDFRNRIISLTGI
jgi:XcyI restriction endonuclease